MIPAPTHRRPSFVSSSSATSSSSMSMMSPSSLLHAGGGSHGAGPGSSSTSSSSVEPTYRHPTPMASLPPPSAAAASSPASAVSQPMASPSPSMLHASVPEYVPPFLAKDAAAQSHAAVAAAANAVPTPTPTPTAMYGGTMMSESPANLAHAARAAGPAIGSEASDTMARSRPPAHGHSHSHPTSGSMGHHPASTSQPPPPQPSLQSPPTMPHPSHRPPTLPTSSSVSYSPTMAVPSMSRPVHHGMSQDSPSRPIMTSSRPTGPMDSVPSSMPMGHPHAHLYPHPAASQLLVSGHGHAMVPSHHHHHQHPSQPPPPQQHVVSHPSQSLPSQPLPHLMSHPSQHHHHPHHPMHPMHHHLQHPHSLSHPHTSSHSHPHMQMHPQQQQHNGLQPQQLHQLQPSQSHQPLQQLQQPPQQPSQQPNHGASMASDMTSISLAGMGTKSAPVTRPGSPDFGGSGSNGGFASSSPKRRYPCPQCPKRFTRPSSLQSHLYVHTGEKPFVCTARGPGAGGCGRAFSVLSNLRRHARICTGEPATAATTPSASGSIGATTPPPTLSPLATPARMANLNGHSGYPMYPNSNATPSPGEWLARAAAVAAASAGIIINDTNSSTAGMDIATTPPTPTTRSTQSARNGGRQAVSAPPTPRRVRSPDGIGHSHRRKRAGGASRASDAGRPAMASASASASSDPAVIDEDIEVDEAEGPTDDVMTAYRAGLDTAGLAAARLLGRDLSLDDDEDDDISDEDDPRAEEDNDNDSDDSDDSDDEGADEDEEEAIRAAFRRAKAHQADLARGELSAVATQEQRRSRRGGINHGFSLGLHVDTTTAPMSTTPPAVSPATGFLGGTVSAPASVSRSNSASRPQSAPLATAPSTPGSGRAMANGHAAPATGLRIPRIPKIRQHALGPPALSYRPASSMVVPLLRPAGIITPSKTRLMTPTPMSPTPTGVATPITMVSTAMHSAASATMPYASAGIATPGIPVSVSAHGSQTPSGTGSPPSPMRVSVSASGPVSRHHSPAPMAHPSYMAKRPATTASSSLGMTSAGSVLPASYVPQPGGRPLAEGGVAYTSQRRLFTQMPTPEATPHRDNHALGASQTLYAHPHAHHMHAYPGHSSPAYHGGIRDPMSHLHGHPPPRPHSHDGYAHPSSQNGHLVPPSPVAGRSFSGYPITHSHGSRGPSSMSIHDSPVAGRYPPNEAQNSGASQLLAAASMLQLDDLARAQRSASAAAATSASAATSTATSTPTSMPAARATMFSSVPLSSSAATPAASTPAAATSAYPATSVPFSAAPSVPKKAAGSTSRSVRDD